MVDWTMKVLETVGTVMALASPCAQGLKFSRVADDEMQDPVVDDNLYVPLYYKRKENHTARVNEPLVKLVVAQLAPWSLSHDDIENFTNIPEVRLIIYACLVYGFNPLSSVSQLLYRPGRSSPQSRFP